MLNYETFVCRHGEFAVQALIERMERYEGVSPRIGALLEERWIDVMEMGRKTPAQAMAA
jgi:hypothetical protein